MKFLRKLEQLVFYFLLFAIPFQTRKILWQQAWHFNEYQSAFIYGTDVLLAILFMFWAFNYFRANKFTIYNLQFTNNFQLSNFSISKLLKPNFFLFIFVAVSAISIKNSSSQLLSFYNFIKLIEFVLFYFYIKSYAAMRFNLGASLLALIAGGVFQSVIAIGQFLKQSDLGLKYLGESILRIDMTGVAVFFNLTGQKILRAYGTTPHPNVLAAYIFLAMFAFYFAYLYYNFYHQKKLYPKKLNPYLLSSYFLMLFGFFFSFARTVIFLWFAGFAVRAVFVLTKDRFRKIFNIKLNRDKLTKILAAGGLAILIFSVFYWPEIISRVKISGGDEAVQLRMFYNKESLKSINWFGVGTGNFVNWLTVKDPNLPRELYQPVHNIYLLIFSETGILGIGSFILFLMFLIKDYIKRTRLERFYHISFFVVALSFLAMGLFDHFLWTLQQGRFMFWLTTAGILSQLAQNKIS